MLRPTYLLPAARLSSPHGLLTPRSGTEVSLRYLGSATRRTDAYRHGTLTRWRSAASGGRAFPLRSRSYRRVTTHHPFRLAGPERRGHPFLVRAHAAGAGAARALSAHASTGVIARIGDRVALTAEGTAGAPSLGLSLGVLVAL